MKVITYFHGDAAEYTSKSVSLHGWRWFEIKILEGHLKGQLKHTSKCPDCRLEFGQDKSGHCMTCVNDIIG